MFSNSTDGEMFTRAYCARCRYAYEGDQFCDEAAGVFWDDPPEFLVRVPLSDANPVGVECRRFEGSAT